MNSETTRKKIEAEFDPKLTDLWESKSLDRLLFRMKAPGTRTECGFRVQVEVYEVLDGPVEDRRDEFHHVKYLGYIQTDCNPKTAEIPEFFLSLGQELLRFEKGDYFRK